MPYVNLQITKGASREQKAKLLAEFTESLVLVLGKRSRLSKGRGPVTITSKTTPNDDRSLRASTVSPRTRATCT